MFKYTPGDVAKSWQPKFGKSIVTPGDDDGEHVQLESGHGSYTLQAAPSLRLQT